MSDEVKAATESELRRMIEDCKLCWGVFDASDSLVRVDLNSEIELADDGTYVRCLHLVPLSELEVSDAACKWCGGKGSVDSGGFTEWGSPIEIPCQFCGETPTC